jgi:putative DNA primase/helicase
MERTQQRANLLAVEPDGIPQELKMRPQWVVWGLEERDDKPTKVPYGPISFERASTTDMMTWGTFEDALAASKMGNFDGIGFVFCSADPFVGIDIDDCRDPETGEIEEWARGVIERFPDAYVEASPSGTGVHIIVRGRRREGKRKGRVEMYGQERFFTVTGVAP